MYRWVFVYGRNVFCPYHFLSFPLGSTNLFSCQLNISSSLYSLGVAWYFICTDHKRKTPKKSWNYNLKKKPSPSSLRTPIWQSTSSRGQPGQISSTVTIMIGAHAGWCITGYAFTAGMCFVLLILFWAPPWAHPISFRVNSISGPSNSVFGCFYPHGSSNQKNIKKSWK